MRKLSQISSYAGAHNTTFMYDLIRMF